MKLSEQDKRAYAREIAEGIIAGRFNREATLEKGVSHGLDPAEWLAVIVAGQAEADRILGAIESKATAAKRELRQRLERIYEVAMRETPILGPDGEQLGAKRELAVALKACAEIAKLDGLYAKEAPASQHVHVHPAPAVEREERMRQLKAEQRLLEAQLPEEKATH